MLPEAYANLKLALTAYKQIAGTFKQEIEVFANFPSNYLGLINEDESIEFTDGALRLIDPKGAIIEDGMTASRFTEVIGEAVENYSYTKFVYYKPLGYPEGSYRVGPLARLNIVKSMGTPQADKELAEFKQISAGPVESSFHYHHARLVEALYGIEKIEQILTDPLILDKHVRATAGVNRLEGAGQIEAPRGTLNHHYKVDENGKITWANLVVATGHNNNAMNKGVLQSASLCEGRQVHRGRSQPRRGRDPHLRSLPQLLHPRLRPDAAGSHSGQRRRRRSSTSSYIERP
jgi:NAD-reducing hydrogenase large subunit